MAQTGPFSAHWKHSSLVAVRIEAETECKMLPRCGLAICSSWHWLAAVPSAQPGAGRIPLLNAAVGQALHLIKHCTFLRRSWFISLHQ